MALATPTPPALGIVESEESYASAISWGAVIGGAVAAGAITLLLVTLGSGVRPLLGLALVVGESERNDVYPPGRCLAHHRAVAVIRHRRLSSGAATHQMDRASYRRGIFPRYGTWLLGLGTCLGSGCCSCHFRHFLGCEHSRQCRIDRCRRSNASSSGAVRRRDPILYRKPVPGRSTERGCKSTRSHRRGRPNIGP